MVQVGKCAEASISLRQLKWVARAVFISDRPRQAGIQKSKKEQERFLHKMSPILHSFAALAAGHENTQEGQRAGKGRREQQESGCLAIFARVCGYVNTGGVGLTNTIFCWKKAGSADQSNTQKILNHKAQRIYLREGLWMVINASLGFSRKAQKRMVLNKLQNTNAKGA